MSTSCVAFEQDDNGIIAINIRPLKSLLDWVYLLVL